MSNSRKIDPQIIRWLSGLSESLQTNLRYESPDLYLQYTAKVDTRTLESAICTHLEWRDRLEELFAMEVADRLQADQVARNDFCALGQWLHGEGEQVCGQQPAFVRLKEAHAEFHRLTGALVSQAQSGDAAGARVKLGEPAYLAASWRVVEAIADLSAAVGAAGKNRDRV